MQARPACSNCTTDMAVAFTAVLLLLLQASISAETSDVAEEPLYFMFVSSTSSVFNSSGTAPAVDLALEKINGGSSLLSGYTLRYPMPLDSKVSSGVRLHAED